METPELEKQVFTALISDAELMTLLPNGALSIFHYVMPSSLPDKYPAVVYSTISDVPALAGDNQELAHRVTIRIHVITREKNTVTEQAKFLNACKAIKRIMTCLGFVRRQTTPFLEDGRAILIYDYLKGVES